MRKNTLNNNLVRMLINITTNLASFLDENEFKVATYLYGLMCYEPVDDLFIYLNEMDYGIEFFNEYGKRIFHINGLKLGEKEIQRCLRTLRGKEIIEYKEIVPHCFYKVSKGHLRQGCFY